MAVYENARELESNLPVFLTQEYGQDYRVIVVEESSTDDTEDVLKLQKQQYSHLYTTFLPKPYRHVTQRKLALTLGVKASTSQWIILTDIYSVPASAEWLKQIDETISSTTEVLFGYSGKKGLKLQTFDQLEDGVRLVRKTERRRADGHKGKLLRYLRGKYDFVAVPASRAHDLLRYYEQDIRGLRLLGLRISVMFHNLID